MIIIRQALKKDLPRILELYKQLSFTPETHRSPEVRESEKILKRIEEYPGCTLLVAEEAGLVVGTTFVAVLPGFAHGTSPFAVVEYVVVDEKYRSKGIGKKLMEAAMGIAKSAGCYKVMLTSDLRRERAHKFYKTLGFEASAAGFRYYFSK